MTAPTLLGLKGPVRAIILASRPLSSAALRSAVANSTDIRIVGEAVSLCRLEHLLVDMSPEALLIDGTDPVWDTFEAIRLVRGHRGRRVGIVVLSELDSTDNALRYLRAGADALVLNDSSLDDIANALRVVAQGHAVLPPPIVRSLVDLMSIHLPALPGSRNMPDLTNLKLITTGLSNQEVADNLVLSEKTVKFHVSNLLRKLGVRNRAQAIVYAHDRRLLEAG